MAKKDDLPGKQRSIGIRKTIRLLSLATMAAIVVREMRKPPEERTWSGTVASVVPYDLRPPTVDRVRDRMWNPEGPVVGPKVFGVGWTVNAGRVMQLVRDRTGS